jgi:cold shock CspA family protein
MAKGTGIISQFNADRRFGFIKPDGGGQEVYFRSDVFKGGSPAEGSRVEFNATQGGRGLKATAVHVLKETLPPECVFETFYKPAAVDGQRHLKDELFFEAPAKAAAYLEKAGLTSSSLRMLFQGFRAFAARLEQGGLTFDRSRELFGDFYVQKVVRQNRRGMLPDPVVALFDAHRDLILKDGAEMKGFYRYLTYILCYFGDKTK